MLATLLGIPCPGLYLYDVMNPSGLPRVTDLSLYSYVVRFKDPSRDKLITVNFGEADLHGGAVKAPERPPLSPKPRITESDQSRGIKSSITVNTRPILLTLIYRMLPLNGRKMSFTYLDYDSRMRLADSLFPTVACTGFGLIASSASLFLPALLP